MAGISGSITTIVGHEHLRTFIGGRHRCLPTFTGIFLMPALKHQIIYYGSEEAKIFFIFHPSASIPLKFFLKNCFIEVWLHYNVVLITAVQQSDLVICIHTFSYSFPLWFITGY